jgi:AraC-like DNA-binding protein/GNAT superfamily N-acetyltransferase
VAWLASMYRWAAATSSRPKTRSRFAGRDEPETLPPTRTLVYAASGVLSVHTEGGTWIVPANRVAWIPARSTHHHRAHGETDMRIVFWPPALARQVSARPAVFLASGLAREIPLTLTGRRHLDRGARARLQRVLVDELRVAHEQPTHLPEPDDIRLRAVARILDDNPADNSPLAALGQQVGAGARTLSRLFHDELGMTYYEWRTQLRICHALVLLAEGPRHDARRARLRMGEPQQLHRRFHHDRRHHPRPPSRERVDHEQMTHRTISNHGDPGCDGVPQDRRRCTCAASDGKLVAVVVALREITGANREAVLALSVAPGQERFVSSVSYSLREAAEYPQAKPWYRAVYVGDEPVGFVMLSWNVEPQPPEINGPWFLWKLLIDQRHQGRGYGLAVVRRIVELVHAEGATELLTSYVPAADGPEGFYQRLGFVPTGELDPEGEVIMRLPLPWTQTAGHPEP